MVKDAVARRGGGRCRASCVCISLIRGLLFHARQVKQSRNIWSKFNHLVFRGMREFASVLHHPPSSAVGGHRTGDDRAGRAGGIMPGAASGMMIAGTGV
jgi:hypothetical protein